MNDDNDSRPRARAVNMFDKVHARHGGQPEPEESPPQPMQGMPLTVVERPINRRRELVKSAASREVDRFAALTGVLGTHLWTSAAMWPLLIVVLKIIVSGVLFSTNSLAHFTWLQAILLSGGLWLAGPLVFFLYRYWSGKF